MTDSGSSRPNIVLILTDHFRRDFIGACTPNLMSTAARGVRFSNAYCAAPLCQPSRLSIATGLFPSQHGACGNQSPPVADAVRDATFMNLLRTSGYHTALIGKHHYIDRYGIGMDVRHDDDELRRYGFDEVLQVVDDGENQHNDDSYTDHLRDKGLLHAFRAQFGSGTKSGHHPFDADLTADGFIGCKAEAFVRNCDLSRPFYLNVGFIGPHPPYWFPGEPSVDPSDMPAPVGAQDSEAVRKRRARYAEKVKLIDRYVGRLIDALTERGVLDRTVLIFTSDHGDNLGDFGIWDKRYFYEHSCGVPLIVSGPGVPGGERLNGPRVSASLVSLVDLYPTILNLSGVGMEPDRRRRGRDLLATVTGAAEPIHDAVFAELATALMIRTAAWKMVFDSEQGGVRYLFNLFEDPCEEHNLAGVTGYENVVRALLERMLAERIRRSQFTHVKEEQRLQSVRAR